MMCYRASGYIIFSLRKLKFYGGWEPGAGCEGRGRITQTRLLTSIPEISENVCFYFMIVLLFHYKYLQELIKRRSKVQEKNMSCESPLTFDQLKSFPKTISH